VRELGEIPENPEGLVETYRGYPDARMDVLRKTETPGEYDFWLRVGLSPTAGELTLKIDGSEAGKFSPLANRTVLKWVKLGSYDLSEGQHTFTLVNHNGENVLDELVVVPHKSYMNHKNEILKILEEKNTIYLGSNMNAASFEKIFQNYKSIPVHWKRIDPTKYELTVNLTTPSFLFFSEMYDSRWVANLNGEDIRSTVSYSAFNSFPLRRVGNVNLTVVFSPQRYVLIGSVISGLAVTTVVVFLVATSRHTVKPHSLFLNKRCQRTRHASVGAH
jgi:hypothetical protein